LHGFFIENHELSIWRVLIGENYSLLLNYFIKENQRKEFTTKKLT